MKILENSVIKLRNLELNDLDFLYDTENKIELWEISNTVTPYSKHVLEEFIKTGHKDIFTKKQHRFIIETIAEKEPVGLIDLFDYEPIHLRAGVGIIITDKNRRKKYATEALELLKNYCFQILKLNQLYCNISEDNNKSLELFKKSGFKINGKKEKWLNSEKGFKDVLFLQLFNE